MVTQTQQLTTQVESGKPIVFDQEEKFNPPAGEVMMDKKEGLIVSGMTAAGFIVGLYLNSKGNHLQSIAPHSFGAMASAAGSFELYRRRKYRVHD